MSVSFFDSNVILYMASRGTRKSQRVEQLVNEGGHVSVQVLNECVNVLRRKYKNTWSETREFVTELNDLVLVWPVTVEIHHDGIRLAERYGFAIYDSFIVAAALSLDCQTLWSEDMQHGMVVDGRLTITNPFTSGEAHQS